MISYDAPRRRTGRWLEVELAPGAGASVRITMERCVNEPRYETTMATPQRLDTDHPSPLA